MWATDLWQQGVMPLQWGVAIGASLVAAIVDLRERRIPNRLTGPLLAAGFVWAGFAGGVGGVADAALACVVLAFPFVVLFVFAGGGAGDAKLMGALGAWLGLINGAIALAAVCLAGIALAVVFAIAKQRLRAVGGNLVRWSQAVLLFFYTRGGFRVSRSLAPKVEEMQTIPYGVAILVGVSVAGLGVNLWCV